MAEVGEQVGFSWVGFSSRAERVLTLSFPRGVVWEEIRQSRGGRVRNRIRAALGRMALGPEGDGPVRSTSNVLWDWKHYGAAYDKVVFLQTCFGLMV